MRRLVCIITLVVSYVYVTLQLTAFAWLCDKTISFLLATSRESFCIEKSGKALASLITPTLMPLTLSMHMQYHLTTYVAKSRPSLLCHVV